MRKADTYHHGHLREALLEAARELVIQGGVEALTLREVARRAGVSTAAPYHHFADKAELVGALARKSLTELDHVSGAAIDGIADPRLKLQALGVAYVMFAVEHPAEFRLMFRPEIGSPFEHADPHDMLAFGHVLDVVAELRAHGVGEGDVQTGAVAAWSLVHGLAALLVDGPLRALAADLEHVRRLATTVTAKLPMV